MTAITDAEVEAAARAECLAEGVDPEHECVGLGDLMPVGEVWSAWKVRVPRVRAALAASHAHLRAEIEAAEARFVSVVEELERRHEARVTELLARLERIYNLTTDRTPTAWEMCLDEIQDIASAAIVEERGEQS